ncbi:MAG TPA: hypothetical protein ENH72_09170 [Pseudomonas sabulinigri]|uniref:Uncharacterized protein n=1 Tax=marine sediment metagenome TaxID=412755 RepID=A0A0F9VT85_9ZZZZ|nr:hypothetical protein [Halopseudomonas sabulinigri]HEC50343.1 hypothetical protein [Halopseudomonas sabulinigri]
MHTAKNISDWNDKTEAGLYEWWSSMANKGMAHHPDDDPASIVYVENGAPFFDSKASAALCTIYAEMEKLHDDLIYVAAHKAIMSRLAWERSLPENEW